MSQWSTVLPLTASLCFHGSPIICRGYFLFDLSLITVAERMCLAVKSRLLFGIVIDASWREVQTGSKTSVKRFELCSCSAA